MISTEGRQLQEQLETSSPSTVEARSKAVAGTVRAMERADLHAVADLFTRTFRKSRRQTDPTLAAYLEDVFFTGPLYSPEVGSLVHVNDQGVIDSAILAMPVEFTVYDRPVTARVLCAFMAEGKSGAAGAARIARMLRAVRQDFCFTDNASPVSADHWGAGGGVTLPIQSLEWHRTFRPVAAWLNAARRKMPILTKLPIRGVAEMLDRIARRRSPSLAATAQDGTDSAEASPEEFLTLARQFVARFSVRPSFSTQEFDWLFTRARLNTSLGEVYCRTVRNDQGSAIGCYLYYGTRGGTAVLLDIFAEARQEDVVVAQMFADLDHLGYASAQGMAQPFLIKAVLRQRHLVHKHTGYFCLVTRHADLKAAAIANDFYAGGLASERWSRLLQDF